MKRISIALVGDFDEKMYTHHALNESIAHCKPHLPFVLDATWISTDRANEILAPNTKQRYHGIWIAPGSPYKNDDNVLTVIQFARKNDIPTLGNCGGFQYMILEYARNVLGLSDAIHEETSLGSNALISKLSCSLKGQEEQIVVQRKASWLYQVLQVESIVAKYYCSYGVNRSFYNLLNRDPLVFTAFSKDGEVRAFELRGHRFFNGTLFQPSLDSYVNRPNPLLLSFMKLCA